MATSRWQSDQVMTSYQLDGPSANPGESPSANRSVNAIPERAARAGLVIRAATLTSFACLALAPLPLVAHDDHPAPKKYEDEKIHRPTPVPDRIVLTWDADPRTTQAVSWRTDTSVSAATAEVSVAEHGPLFAVKGKKFPAKTTAFVSDLGPAHYHSVRFDGLQPKTRYAYRVGDGVNWSEWCQFQTASEEPDPFSFVYFGDAQNDVRSLWSRVVREAHRESPKAAFFLHAGDLINRANRDAEWGDWFQAGGFISSMIPYVPSPGNHEYDTGQLTRHWAPMFRLPENGPPELPETTYWFDYQGARIISLNSNKMQEEQALWLSRVLESNPSKWTIITFHHPIYSSGKGRDNPKLRDTWQPVFDRFRVDLVLQGHDHTYARSGLMSHENVATGVTKQSETSGTVYVVSVSGPKMYRLNRTPLMIRAAENTQLFQIITVDGDILRYEARTAVGTLYDAFTLRKRTGAPNELIDRIPNLPERKWLDELSDEKKDEKPAAKESKAGPPN